MNEIKSCMMCKSEKVKLTYLENARYRVECPDCGQYLEFNAPSEMAARVLWNRTFRNDCEDRWIPVSERLPEETGYYLITNKAGRTEHLWYKSTEKKWYFFNSDIEHLHAIAWCILPEPYKEVPNE